MERKLATIAKIASIQGIENADKIEMAIIRGWQVVVQKSENYKPGDLCVYCEIDSLLPERPEFEFMAPRKYRVKTTKLRGQISQGIAFPLRTVFPSDQLFRVGDSPTLYLDYDQVYPNIKLEPGVDVTDILGITKYEAPIPACLSGKVLGNFPSHSIKTDEERIQNLMEIYPEYQKYTWVATEKLDGSSASYFIKDDIFGVASRKLELKEDAKNSFWAVARALNVEYKMRLFMASHNLKALTLQGELIGEGIQKNKYRIKGQTVRFFRAFDPMTYKFLPYEEFVFAMDEMRLTSVPIVDDDFKLTETPEELIKYADGRSALCETAREGIVFVAKDPAERYQGRLSFKVISNKFILKHDA